MAFTRAGNAKVATGLSAAALARISANVWPELAKSFSALAGLAGMLYAPQVGIITPAQIGVLPSLEMVIWVAVGGRGSLAGAILGAMSVNYGRSVLTNYFPELWPFILGGLFVLVVLLFPDGLVGMIRKGKGLLNQRKAGEGKAAVSEGKR